MASVTFNFAQADGAPTGWAGVATSPYVDLEVHGGRLQISSTAEYEGYTTSLGGMTLNSFQIDADLWAPNVIGDGSVGFTMFDPSFNGYQGLFANSTHVYEFVGGVRGSYVTNDPRPVTQCHGTMTYEQALGRYRMYYDGTLNSEWTFASKYSGFTTLLVYMNAFNYPTDVAWIDNIVVSDTVTGPPAPALEQEGFRWRNDDGSETTATWAASQDTDVTAPSGANLRLRALVDGG